MVVLIPSKEEVYCDIARHDLPVGNIADIDHPLRVRHDFCPAQALHCCDLTAELQQEARRGRQLYLRISSHWNDEGNAVGGSAVARCLTEQGVLKQGRASGAGSAVQ